MERINKLAVIPAILIALLGTASFTIVLANWDKIFTSNSSSNIDSKKLSSLEKQLEELERLDSPTVVETIKPKVKDVEPITTSTVTATEQPKTVKTVVKEGIKFDLLGCEKQGQIICHFNLTATIKDSKINIFPHTGRIVADGMEYKATSGSIGGKIDPIMVGSHLIEGVTMKSYLIYPQIPPATKIDFIEFTFENKSLTGRGTQLLIKDIQL